MIKRRFYKFEHADKDNVSDSSSSSSDSELEVEASEESESEPEQEVAAQVNQNNQACSSSSGYESEDSSANEVGVDSAGLIDDDNDESEDDKQIFITNRLHAEHGAQIRGKKWDVPCNKEPLPDDFPACILKCKSVFKCKLCPRIVCLNEETVRAHFNSKRHARSEKLLKEGRLKTMLNSDGEIENQETAAEAHSPVVAIEQDKQKTKHKGGRHRRGKGSKRKRMRDEKQSTKDGAKRGRKDEN
ncbi:hypothetical protein Gotri_018607 [Gossypium trilobum]|uniref:Uncharacterized protein n=3 Tax=Gossypium TaxID=3633 RepID=A0A0D2PB64_GOSRA|nr:uncharacterized protein LOC105803548 isoform X1 [Gossypium raimondii]KJB42992.1 hypothetical protein B456_007G178700 [Gossypium raimondii]KJB42994.1 hypothetical protein B456_007G178700 [Gossypium raimondii]MBA0590257.1 hypothetical protein [Gossypium raimondii]MBA0769921.1 hypothetical protein [Gossypium trilobum]